MQTWSPPERSGFDDVDPVILEETALATAQATIQIAMNSARLSKSELAGRMGRGKSFVSRIMSGSHNLTIRTFARALAACGLEPTFGTRPVQSTWVSAETSSQLSVPAGAGTPVLAA